MSEVINMKNDFKQVSSWQYILHVSASTVVLELVNRYESDSFTYSSTNDINNFLT